LIDSLSIIFPVYNEASRLKKSFFKINNFLIKKKFTEIEIIFVDDGSYDCSNKLIQKFINQKCFIYKKVKFKLIKLKKNYGKGFALKQGVKYATKNWILTSDIDQSVSLNQIIKWKNHYVTNSCSVYFGSRLIDGSKVKKTKTRYLFGILFRLITMVLFKKFKLDTQCGFKLYKQKNAKKIFSNLHIAGFSHDIEILIICSKLKYNFKELPVNWTHVGRGKLNIFYHPIIMLIEIIKICLNTKSVKYYK
jgi:dolichyl-phosphate beta-glucosyltransferase